MSKSKSADKIKLNSFDDLFGAELEPNGESGIQEVALSDLYEFKGHPFRVMDDEKMEETVESVRNYGVLVPGIVRKREAGGYEIIAGHRRKRACELAGLAAMPVMVREYTDGEATVIMVDSNLQREDILPSEKAKAYQMKFEALKHQGSQSGKQTYAVVGEAAGDNGKMVQRYLRLAELIPELLHMVDEKKLGFIAGVELSFLTEMEQGLLYQKMAEFHAVPNGTQAAAFKKYSLSGELNEGMMELLLSEEKPKAKKVVLKTERIQRYFHDNCSSDEIEEVIYRLLERWKQEGGFL